MQIALSEGALVNYAFYDPRVRKRAVVIGIVAGLIAAGLLVLPAKTPAFAIAALFMPVVAGAVAAIFATRRANGELDVDEAAGLGAAAGLAGGFVISVPFPLALQLYLSNTSGRTNPFATGVGVGTAFVMFLAFVAVSIVSAVIAARVTAR